MVEDILNTNSSPIEIGVLNEMTETLKPHENQSPPDHKNSNMQDINGSTDHPFSHISDKEQFIKHNKGFIDL